MSANPFTILQPAKEFPCATCKSECCSGIPLVDSELNDIVNYLDTLPRAALKRLARQRRDPTMCMFVDTEHWRCSVYSVRPWLCRMFGKIPRLKCDYAPERIHDIPPEQAEAEFNAKLLPQEPRYLTAYNPVATIAPLMVPVMKWEHILLYLGRDRAKILK